MMTTTRMPTVMTIMTTTMMMMTTTMMMSMTIAMTPTTMITMTVTIYFCLESFCIFVHLKVELHLHLDGSLSPEFIAERAAARGIEMPAPPDR